MTGANNDGREVRTTMRKLQHDLRTPIGQIIGYGEMLQEEIRDRGLTEFLPDLDHIRSAANTLLGLVDGIFHSDETAGRPASPEDRAIDGTTQGATGAPAGRLLVVDDDAGNRALLRRWLSGDGFSVTEVAGGRAALDIIERQTFDLVVLDVMMPDVDGLQTLGWIRSTRTVVELPVIMATALSDSRDVVAALNQGANDYVTKPFDRAVVTARVRTQLALRSASREVEALAQQLEIRNAFMRRTFGRYLSDEVVTSLFERDEGFEIGGERRRVSILLADLRGFTTLTETLSPGETVSVLNNYLGVMSEVIHSYQGTVDEFIGDAILVLFGALSARDDDAERAVACAIAMQQAVGEVNRLNAEQRLPGIEMGIGIATGEVIVGNVGSERRSKHTAIGSAVNLASRIESYTLGGEILVSEATIDEVGDMVRVDRVREVWPKGFDAPMPVFRVESIGGAHDLLVPQGRSELVELAERVRVRFTVLDGKAVSGRFHDGHIAALSSTGALLHADVDVDDLADIRIEFVGPEGAGACYAKVVDRGARSRTAITVRFSAGALDLHESLGPEIPLVGKQG
jgi:class 3 adenylate cyclase